MNYAPVMTVLYDTHEQAEQAVRKLQQHGFDMRQLSIVGRDYHAEEKEKLKRATLRQLVTQRRQDSKTARQDYAG